MRISKYAALTEHLIKSSKDTIRMSFEDLNKIIPVPAYAYIDRPSWANCTTMSATSFQRSWLSAGYRVSMVDLKGQQVEFAKSSFAISADKQSISTAAGKQKTAPNTVEEELLLTVPENLTILERDEYLMVRLNKYN